MSRWYYVTKGQAKPKSVTDTPSSDNWFDSPAIRVRKFVCKRQISMRQPDRVQTARRENKKKNKIQRTKIGSKFWFWLNGHQINRNGRQTMEFSHRRCRRCRHRLSRGMVCNAACATWGLRVDTDNDLGLTIFRSLRVCADLSRDCGARACVALRRCHKLLVKHRPQNHKLSQ